MGRTTKDTLSNRMRYWKQTRTRTWHRVLPSMTLSNVAMNSKAMMPATDILRKNVKAQSNAWCRVKMIPIAFITAYNWMNRMDTATEHLKTRNFGKQSRTMRHL